MKKRISLSKAVVTYIIVSGLIFGSAIAVLMMMNIIRSYDDAYVQLHRERIERTSESINEKIIEVESTVKILAATSTHLYEKSIGTGESALETLEEDYYWLLKEIMESKSLPSKDVFIYLNPFIDNDTHDVWLSKDEDGRIHRHEEIPIERYRNHDNMDWYYGLEDLGHSRWTHSYVDSQGENQVAYITPLFYEDIFIGIIGMYLDTDAIESLINQISQGKESFFWMVDDKDVLIYHPFYKSGQTIEDVGYDIYGKGWDSSYAEDVVENTTFRHFISITGQQWKIIYTVSEVVFVRYKLDIIRKSVMIFVLTLVMFYLMNRYYLKDYQRNYEKLLSKLRKNKSNGRYIELQLGFKTDAEEIIEAINGDYQEIQALKKSLDYMTNNNRITGIPNWVRMQERLDLLIEDESVQQICVIDIDMDYFKRINELLGHSVGNDVLRKIGFGFEAIGDQHLEFYHTDGDAFVALVTDKSSSTINLVAEKIQACIQGIEIEGDYDLNLSCSMGVSCYPDHGRTSGELLKFAEMALYTSKANGKNRVSVFERSMYHRLTELKMLEDDFLNAIRENQFILHYQLKFDSTGTPTGVEALVRWQHPERGIIYPDNFIEYAEQTGYIIELGDLVLKQACRDFRKMQEDGMGMGHLAVNFSSVQLREDNFVAYVLGILQSEGLHYEYLEIEITETMLIYDRENSIAKLRELRDFGVQISLDDFGSGYASINNIKDLPICRLKIDREFLSDIEENPRVIKMLYAVAKMAHSLDLQVTAEGVETKRQLTLLQDCEIDEFQGFYLAKPKTIGEIINENMDRR